MIFQLVILLLFAGYSILIMNCWSAWKRIPLFIPAIQNPKTKVSVIIPARNEEDNIAPLLGALQTQTYPKELFEVIVVDDHSTDATASITQQFSSVRLIQLQQDAVNSYKKKAIETGIAAASGDLIVATDADCIPPPGWLETLVLFKEETKSVFIAAPVVINCNSSVLQLFQAMDFMVLQVITGAVVQGRKLSMCNGANIAYERKAFAHVKGFAGIDSIASGDDMLLMYKIEKQFPGRVHYLKSKEAIVTTQPAKTWKAFFSQRIRWASKARKYEDKRILPVLLLVYFLNLSFLALIIAGCWSRQYWLWLGVFWLVKTLVELPLFRSAAMFFNKPWALQLFFFFQPLHILYTIVSGLFSQFGIYEWKGRKVR